MSRFLRSQTIGTLINANEGFQVIQLHYYPSPNPAKVALFLEVAGLPYEVVPVDIRKGEQHHTDQDRQRA